jgi:hypothetical protein
LYLCRPLQKSRIVLQILSGQFGEKNLVKFRKKLVEIEKALTFAIRSKKRGGVRRRKFFERLETTARKSTIYVR